MHSLFTSSKMNQFHEPFHLTSPSANNQNYKNHMDFEPPNQPQGTQVGKNCSKLFALHLNGNVHPKRFFHFNRPGTAYKNGSQVLNALLSLGCRYASA